MNAMKVRIKLLLFCLVTLSAVGCDRVTKNLARTHLAHREGISYCSDTFRLEYAENTGAAMSLGADWPDGARFWLFNVFPVAMLLLLLAYLVQNSRQLHWMQVSALALIFSGGVGNLIDRIFNDSRVPDFMILGISTLRTGIFNVADMCITFGVLGLVGFMLLCRQGD